MSITTEDLIKKIKHSDLKELFASIKLGFEKESLRMKGSRVSQMQHPRTLGSSLCNRFITTDFSEAQLELITPPLEGNRKAQLFLNDIHHFVLNNIQDEFLWPFSIPPILENNGEIPIAKYGLSHHGMFKHIYRVGLGHRYGRGMQAISGFHFNYSLPDQIWSYLRDKDNSLLLNTKSEIYFKMIRNLYEMNWLLIYLFGSSPVIQKILQSEQNDSFDKLGTHDLYLPHATSLRMSEYGYSNTERSNIYISINSLDQYVSDLQNATNKLEKKYEQIGSSQLNSNLLQIEAEYYACGRAKSSDQNTRPISSLRNGGVDFIEIRSLDLNPYSNIGIDHETILFLEVFMILCFLEESRAFDNEDIKVINYNDNKVAKYGRDSAIRIINNGKKRKLKTLGKEILDKMTPIAEQLENEDGEYLKMIKSMRDRLMFTEQTPSERILEDLISKRVSHNDLGTELGLKYKEDELIKHQSRNSQWKILQDEISHSLKKQMKLENITNESNRSFNEFKEEYYSS